MGLAASRCSFVAAAVKAGMSSIGMPMRRQRTCIGNGLVKLLTKSNGVASAGKASIRLSAISRIVGRASLTIRARNEARNTRRIRSCFSPRKATSSPCSAKEESIGCAPYLR
jgi:hypothetical protein